MHLWTNYILTRSNADDDDDAIDAIRPVTVQRNYPSDRVFFFYFPMNARHRSSFSR